MISLKLTNFKSDLKSINIILNPFSDSETFYFQFHQNIFRLDHSRMAQTPKNTMIQMPRINVPLDCPPPACDPSSVP